MEEWKDIAGEPGYQVSSLGRVRTIDRIVVSSDGRLMRFKGCTRRLSYHRVKGKVTRVSVTIRHRARLVHHLVLVAFVRPRPSGLEGCHNDGNGRNNCVTNLRWDTRESNVDDVYRHGVRKRDWSGGNIRNLGGRLFVSGYLCGIAGLI